MLFLVIALCLISVQYLPAHENNIELLQLVREQWLLQNLLVVTHQKRQELDNDAEERRQKVADSLAGNL